MDSLRPGAATETPTSGPPKPRYPSPAVAVRIGIGLFTGQVPPGSDRTFEREYREAIDLVRLAETVGFDSAWVSEHHGAGDGYLPSLLPMLAAFAAATSRIALGTGVILTPFHDPLRLAEDAAAVDQLSGGRLILGLGLAWREEEFRMFGQPIAERVHRTTEAVEILRRAWTAERFSYQGRIHSYDRVLITPPPAQEGGIPIYLGGSTDQAVRRAGRLGDGYIRSRSDVDSAKRALAQAEDGARAAGKNPRALAFAQLKSAFVSDEEDAWALVRQGARHHIGVYSGWDEGSDTPGQGFWVSPPDDERLRGIVAAGAPDEVAAELRPWVESFGDRDEFHLIVRMHYPGMDLDVAARSVELFAERVMPRLRGA
jgi:probable F420-dependent oxidoreductase